MKDYLKKRPPVFGKITTKDVKLERPVKEKRPAGIIERVRDVLDHDELPAARRAERPLAWLDIGEGVAEMTTDGLTYEEWLVKRAEEEREEFMKNPDYNIGYARKMAAQIMVNQKSLIGSQEDLAQHLMDAGIWNDSVFHKEWRKKLDINLSMHWIKTKQGHEFWQRINAVTHVIPEHTGEKHI